jgi:periplasmic protein TonB
MFLSIALAVIIATAPVTPPRVTMKRVEPQFSDEALQMHASGTVRLKVYVGADGRVQDVWILQGVGFGLDREAVKAVEQWEFRPAMRLGKPIEGTAYVECNFAPSHN